MPHEVTMPQLGMAQDVGKIVSWLKAPGDAVSKGDALFEVETDKAVMEVEAPGDGFLTGVRFDAGEDVPVGQVIARITETADAPADEAAETAEGVDQGGDADETLPDGLPVTMPQLGMAQDNGLLVQWLKTPGDEVSAGDILFEVETDKSTMEVEAGRDGWLAATLAEAGEDVPVGDPVAIISTEQPEAPIARSVKDSGASHALTAPAPTEPAPATEPAKRAKASDTATPSAPVPSGGRILASPKFRRLVLEQGLDSELLVKAGHAQPFHAADVETLRELSAKAASPEMTAEAPRRLTATCIQDGTTEFCAWAAEQHGLTDKTAIMAGLAAASLGSGDTTVVTVERVGTSQSYTAAPGRTLSSVSETDAPPSLILRDLRGSRVSSVEMGAEDVPVLTITDNGAGLSITLECAASALGSGAAIQLLSEFAGRVEQPLRHLL